MNKKEKIRIIRLLLKQYEKDKNILNSLNQANLYPSINYEDYYQTSSSSKEDYLLHRIQLKQELTKRIIFIEKSSCFLRKFKNLFNFSFKYFKNIRFFKKTTLRQQKYYVQIINLSIQHINSFNYY